MAHEPRHTYPSLRLVAVLAILVTFSACEQQQPTFLERESLFGLEIGRLEDQLDLVTRDGVMPRAETSIAMQDGMLYVGDGAANKIMEFSSYGDLVRLIYHPDQNPTPVTLGQSGTVGETDLTRIATPFQFTQLGNIAVDSRRHVYAEDRLSSERSIFDEDLGVQLNRTVVRFDDDGTALDYLGQEGIGGTPFPFIERMQVTLRDELVVIAGTTDAKLVYMYTPSGDQIYNVRIGLDRLPIPSEDDSSIAVLDGIVAGVDQYRLYLKISYYRTEVAEDTGEEFGISFEQSRLYWLDLETGRYEGYVELPRGTDDGADAHYELVGVARDEHIFLLARQDVGRTRLVIMNDEGRVLRRRVLEVPEVQLVLRRFRLSQSGVLTGLLGFVDRAEVVWWRADRLLPEAPEESDASR